MSNDKLALALRTLLHTPTARKQAWDALADHDAEKQDNCQGCQTPRACAYHGCMAEKEAEPVAEVYRAHYGGRHANIGFDSVRPLRGAKLPPPGTLLYAARAKKEQ